MRYLLFLVTVTFPFLANSAYTTMTIEGVQQSNGVWTTAGVMDTQGFVRKTGQVSVLGSTSTLPVRYTASTAAKTVFKSFARNLGPIAITAVGAMDVYDWYTSTNLQPCPGEDKFCVSQPANPNYDPSTYNVGYFWVYGSLYGGVRVGSTPHEPCNTLSPTRPLYHSHTVTSSGTSATCKFQNNVNFGYDTYGATRYPCTTYVTSAQYSLASCKGDAVDPYAPTPVYMGDADFDLLPDPSPSVISDGWNNIPQLNTQGIPFDPTSTSFPPYSEWQGDSYFKDGQWFRDRMDISPAPTNSQPHRVRVDVGPIKLTGLTDPNVKPNDTPASSSTAPKEDAKFCDENPQSIACAELGELESDQIEVTEIPVNTSYTSWGSSNSSCPSPRSVAIFDKTISISYQPVCDFVSMLRPLFIGISLVSAAFIIGGFRRSGGGD